MSTSTTQSKNRRDPSTFEGSFEIFWKIHATGEISWDEICELYLIGRPSCQGCRVNSKDNPNCFCRLVPAPKRARKLWQEEALETLGPDPGEKLRPANTPVGLTNLGATCYANCIIQFLYMNTSFREGIFSVERDLLRKDPVLNELGLLFAQLHSSNQDSIDPGPFIRTLKLNTSVQQDCHEFFTLFLSLLERSLSHSNVHKARTVVQDIFRGTVSHVTQCTVCGKESEASSKNEDFYELELNIEGLSNLDESIKDYLSEERLEGENQYLCESCGGRVNARRFIKLQTLPAVLTFQLKRCVFLPETMQKVSMSKFGYPQRLNARRLHDSSQSPYELMYDLSAVVIHEGTAVDSGHFVVRIKNKYSGAWWDFDDNWVFDMGLCPFKKESPSSHEEVCSVGSVNNLNTVQLSSLGFNISSDDVITSSEGVYMLMYSLVNADDNGDSLVNADDNGDSLVNADDNGDSLVKADDNGDSLVNADDNGDSLVNADDNGDKTKRTLSLCDMGADGGQVSGNGSLPLHFSRETEALNASYDSICREYQLRMNEQMNKVTEHEEEVRFVLSEILVPSLEDPFFWIATEWLDQWANSITPPCIDNTQIICLHGKVPVTKVGSMKRVSEKAWDILFSLHGGGPVLRGDDYCNLCLKAEAENKVYRDHRASMKELSKVAMAGIALSSGCRYYLLPSSWLSRWRSYVKSSRKDVSSSIEPERLDVAIESVKCLKHSRLLERPTDLTRKHGAIIQQASTTDGLTMITESDWKFFCKEWRVPEAKAIVAEIEFTSGKGNELAESCDDGENGEVECNKPIIRTSPEMCEICIGQRESHKLMPELIYHDEDIRIFLVHGKEGPGSVLEAPGTTSGPDCRTSKRSRRNESSSSIDLKVSSSTSIHELKRMIWESFGVVKENQKLHKGSREIWADDSTTLADSNILPGDVLWVTDTGIHEFHDTADEVSVQQEFRQTGRV